MFNQHTEMRDQLQNRHEKMVNDVNGFTNCRVELQGLVTTRDPTGPSQKKNYLRKLILTRAERETRVACV